MVKLYKGRMATIEIDEKNLVVKTNRLFSSSKKTIPIKEVNSIELGASSILSKDVVEIYYGNGVEKVQFSKVADAKKAAAEIAEIVRKTKRTPTWGGLAASVFEIGSSLISDIREYKEHREDKERQREEEEKSLEHLLAPGALEYTTYINRKEYGRPVTEEEIKAVFIAEYAKSPRTAEEPWSQAWTEQYGIQNVSAYLRSLVEDGYLEKVVLGKALSTLTGEQLKTILSELSMKTSGAKVTLIRRLVEEADENMVQQIFPNSVYALTEKGVALLKSNQPLLADMRIDLEKAIEKGKNTVPDLKKDEKKVQKKKASRRHLTDAEKLREYKKSLKILYEALKGAEIREQISIIKAHKPTKEDMEHDLREICANDSYSPVPFSKTMRDIRKYKEFYSEEIIDQIYKGQTKYMLFDRAGFSDLIRRISDDSTFDFFRILIRSGAYLLPSI